MDVFETLKYFNEHNPEDYLPENLDNAKAIDDFLEPVHAAFAMFRSIRRELINEIPTDSRGHIVASANRTIHALNELKRFKNSSDARNHRERLIQANQDTFKSIHAIFAYTSLRNKNIEEQQAQAASLQNELRSLQAAMHQDRELLLRDSTALLDSLRTTTLDEGIAKQAKHFADAVEKHNASAYTWLKATGASIVLLLVGAIFGFKLISWVEGNENPGQQVKSDDKGKTANAETSKDTKEKPTIQSETSKEAKEKPTTQHVKSDDKGKTANAETSKDTVDHYYNIRLAISKILIIGILSYITIQCAKIYYSHKHNEVVNQHRLNAITSYKHFLEASKEVEVRSAIISYVAATVFTPQDTGFVNAPINFEAPKVSPEVIVKGLTAVGGTH